MITNDTVEKLREIAGGLKGELLIIPNEILGCENHIPAGEYDAEELIYFIADMLEE